MNLFMRFPGGLKKAFTMSYDDGVRQDRRLIELMDKYKVKGTFNINSGSLCDKNADFSAASGRMSLEEIKKLFENSPHEPAIHGLEHGFEDQQHNSHMAYNILEDKKNLEQLTGRIVRGMAYPFGSYNDRLADCLKACGIVYSRTVESSHCFAMPADWLRLNPSCHHADPKVFELCDSFFEDTKFNPKMFYLWGHSYEFDNNDGFNSWDHIENVISKVSGREDVWYATNIEIFDYTNAYNRLEVSADARMIHNPSAIEVFFAVGTWITEKTYSIKPGETIVLN